MRQLAPLLLGALILSGCQEKLTSPADCPALCPGGEPQIFDEVFSPIVGTDSSFRGYIQPFNSAALLLSNGLRGYEERAIIRFLARSDSVEVRDTLRTYVIDSVAFGLTLVARDTNATGLQVQLYRLPRTLDSTTTYAQVDPAFVPENLVSTIAVPDSVNTGTLRAVIQGVDLARVAIPPADSGVLGLGVRIDAPAPTGVRLGSSASGTGAVFITYATLNVPDTGAAKLRTFTLVTAFNSSLPAVQEADDSTLLTIGGSPSARALLRFDLPARIRDSATVVRATLELTPVAPISGLPTDPARLRARAVLADLGAKSPVESRFGVGVDTVEAGASGTVDIEIVRLMQQLWLASSTRPTALTVALAPELEAASFSSPVFYSTRASDPAVRPRLRVSYLLDFPFENP
ncbi:MAG TPA: hypothetical protein VFZ87_09660 [Gemmatimonadales bacterium]